MNYAAKVSGASNQSFGKFEECNTGINASWILVLFILLVLIVFCVF